MLLPANKQTVTLTAPTDSQRPNKVPAVSSSEQTLQLLMNSDSRNDQETNKTLAISAKKGVVLAKKKRRV
jgi:hypothetical protein